MGAEWIALLWASGAISFCLNGLYIATQERLDLQALFDDLEQHIQHHDMLMKMQQIDPPDTKQGVFGQPHDYEGGFVLLTVTCKQH